jgi:hypothetical protein
MNRRERTLMLILVGTPLLVGLLFLGNIHLFVKPDYDRKREDLEAQVSKKTLEIRKIIKNQGELARWRELSLPVDPHLAQREYNRYLHELLRGKFTELSLQPNTPTEFKGGTGPLNKKTFYTSLPFSVRGEATLPQLVQVMERFERTPLMHKIKSVTLERDQDRKEERGPITVQMTVEALIVEGATQAPHTVTGVDPRLVVLDVFAALRRGPIGVSLLPWVVSARGPLGQEKELASMDRKYEEIAARNVFAGAPIPKPAVADASGEDEIEIANLIFLSEISQTDDLQEAYLYNRATARSQRLRMENGYNTFQITKESAQSMLMRCMVMMI